MFKKIVALFMAFVLVFAMTACAKTAAPGASEPAAATPGADTPDTDPTDANDPDADTPATQPAAAGKPVAEEGAKLHFMHIYPEHANAIDKSLEIIKRDNPGLEINVSVVPWNEATKSIQTAAATDEMYDIFFQWSSQVPGYNDIGLLLDLTPYVDDEWKSWYISDAALQEYSDDGKIVGMPLRGTAVFLIYNKTLFDEKGWKTPTSQEELETLCDTILGEGLIPANYNTGNMGDLTGQAFVDYCLSDTMTADEFETQVEGIVARTIADAEE